MDDRPVTAPPRPDALGDYTNLRAHGDGGHGRFYLATPPARLGLSDDVIVKVVAGSSEAAFRRFTRELRLFSQVRSPYLVTLYDAGQHEDLFFYSMEWCRGGTLAAPVTRLDRAAALWAVRDAALAADALHEAGIAHRDLRPGNVLLRVEGPACVGDLGLAQAGAAGAVTSMAPIGSVGFVDPALIRGESASRASDIYSLGAILHWALTGRHLHPGVDGADPMLAVRAVLGHPPELATAQLSDAEREAVEQMIDDDHARRPPTASAVAALIERLATEGA